MPRVTSVALKRVPPTGAILLAIRQPAHRKVPGNRSRRRLSETAGAGRPSRPPAGPGPASGENAMRSQNRHPLATAAVPAPTTNMVPFILLIMAAALITGMIVGPARAQVHEGRETRR